MQRWISFLRGINVGGRNILPMAELRALLGAQGFTDVKTYIQSGNCVFEAQEKDSAKVSEIIANAIEATFGFRPSVMTVTYEALLVARENNPFPQAESDPKTLHLFFLQAPARGADMEAIQALAKVNEQFLLTDRVFYLYAPEGIGRSKLAAGAERKLGVAATARNLRTVDKMIALAS